MTLSAAAIVAARTVTSHTNHNETVALLPLLTGPLCKIFLPDPVDKLVDTDFTVGIRGEVSHHGFCPSIAQV